MKHIPRIYSTIPLTDIYNIENEKVHHLINVMKIKIQTQIKIFTFEKEALYEVIEIHKKKIVAKKIYLISPLDNNFQPPNLAISSSAAISQIINISTQIGCDKIQIILSDYSKNHFAKRIEKLQKSIIAAMEQSNRIKPTILLEPITLKEFIENNDNICCLLAESSNMAKPDNIKWLLVGPEGGFSKSEIINLEKNTYTLKLPTFILKSEVAVSFGLGFLFN